MSYSSAVIFARRKGSFRCSRNPALKVIFPGWMRGFVPKEINGIRILEGGIGSGCTITSRDLYERTGWMPEGGELDLFRMDVTEVVSLTIEGDEMVVLSWRAGKGIRRVAKK